MVWKRSNLASNKITFQHKALIIKAKGDNTSLNQLSRTNFSKISGKNLPNFNKSLCLNSFVDHSEKFISMTHFLEKDIRPQTLHLVQHCGNRNVKHSKVIILKGSFIIIHSIDIHNMSIFF